MNIVYEEYTSRKTDSWYGYVHGVVPRDTAMRL